MSILKRKTKDGRSWTLLHNPKNDNFELYASKYANGKEEYIISASAEEILSVIEEINNDYQKEHERQTK